MTLAKRLKLVLGASLVTLALAACALPAAAPTATEIQTRHDPDQPFYLVPVTGRILPYLDRAFERAFAFAGRDFGYSPSLKIRPGDILDVTVFESAGSTLFGQAPAPGSAPSPARTPLPSQVVEANGRILIPFVGSVYVAGKSPMEAAHLIEEGLASQTVRPQVIVAFSANGSNTATDNGDFNKPGPFPLTLRGERLLDAVAFGGGGRYPIVETDIRLIRGQMAATIPLQQLIDHPEDNVRVRPNDQIVAIHNPKTFTVLGASAKVAQYNFDTPRVTLAEAVARSGGFVDTVGSPGGVFLFRREPTAQAKQILALADPASIETTAGPGYVLTGATTPMLFRIDMNTSDGYFLAQKVQIADGDVVLIANAEGTQLVKALTILRGVTGIFYDLGRSGGG